MNAVRFSFRRSLGKLVFPGKVSPETKRIGISANKGEEETNLTHLSRSFPREQHKMGVFHV